MQSLKVDTAEILHELGASIYVDEDIEVGTFDFGGESYVPAGPAHVSISVTNAGDGVVALGTVVVAFAAECSRCLEPFTLELSGEVEGFYTTPDKAEEISEDQEWEPLGVGIIDLAHAIESAIRIELPFAPLHSEECAGICPTCGCDRNEIVCNCDTVAVLPGPFDALKALVDGDGDTATE